MRDFERIDWNKHNKFTRTAYSPDPTPVSDAVAEAVAYEKPMEPYVTSLAPQEGVDEITEIQDNGEVKDNVE